jgi:acyl-coenzyme A thioesterase PaaI-like protein
MHTLVPDADLGIDAALEIDVTDENTNGAGGLQGAMTATADRLCHWSSGGRRVGPGVAFSTQDLAVLYPASVPRGPARALARVRRAGRRSVVVQVDVVDAGDDDRLCAVGTATFALVAGRLPTRRALELSVPTA